MEVLKKQRWSGARGRQTDTALAQCLRGTTTAAGCLDAPEATAMVSLEECPYQLPTHGTRPAPQLGLCLSSGSTFLSSFKRINDKGL